MEIAMTALLLLGLGVGAPLFVALATLVGAVVGFAATLFVRVIVGLVGRLLRARLHRTSRLV